MSGNDIDKTKKFDPKQKAVALRYKPHESQAPQVVAKGQGYMAEKILENAEKSDVPVFQDKELAEELSRLDLGDNIPPELYEIVAQVLIYISDLDKLESFKRNDA